MELTLIREAYEDDHTRGTLYVNGTMFRTLEPAWLNNQKNKSCIPEGTYQWELRESPKFKKHILIKNIQNRNLILIHVGNTTLDTRGCILIGKKAGKIQGKEAVLNSRTALEELLTIIKNHNTTCGTLEIKSTGKM